MLTRTGDYYIAHRKRLALAREARADLFVSIHADAFTNSAQRPVEHLCTPCRIAAPPVKPPNGWLGANQSDLLGGVGGDVGKR